MAPVEMRMRIAMRIAPVLFGLGFIAPLLIQIASILGIGDPSSRLISAFAVGSVWGLTAAIMGRWI
jgi:hypothetical protein